MATVGRSEFSILPTVPGTKITSVHESLLQECEKDIIWYRDHFFGKGKREERRERREGECNKTMLTTLFVYSTCKLPCTRYATRSIGSFTDPRPRQQVVQGSCTIDTGLGADHDTGVGCTGCLFKTHVWHGTIVAESDARHLHEYTLRLPQAVQRHQPSQRVACHGRATGHPIV